MIKKQYGKFCEIFGINPRNRIMEFFLEMRGLDFSIGDVARETGLNRATAYNTMEELIKLDYIISARRVSSAQMYKLNCNKKEVKALLVVFDKVISDLVREYSKKPKRILVNS